MTSSKPSKPFATDKIFAHQDRIRAWLDNGLSMPITFELDVTNVCNNKCPACFGFYKGLNAVKMKPDQIRSILGQIAEAGGKGVTFTGGGEPLTHPETPAAVKYARSLGLDVALITNGLALTENIADAILQNCVWTRVSLDAASPEIFKKTHGMDKAAFEKVLANIKILAERKKALKSNCTVGVGFLTGAVSEPDVYAFAELAKELGADYAQYRPLLRRHGEPDIDYTRGNILSEMLRAQKELTSGPFSVLCSEHKYRQISKGEIARNYAVCHGHNFAAVICADLKMYICCHMRGLQKYCIGDLNKNTIKEIWSSDRRAETFAGIKFKDCPPLCRCDSFNRILWDIKTGKIKNGDWPKHGKWEHENFI